MWHIAVLWGLDGTLLDNDEALFNRLRLVAAKHGAAVSEDAFFQEEQLFDMPDGLGGWVRTPMRLHGASDKALYYWMASRNPVFAKKVPPEVWITDLANAYNRYKHAVKLRPHVAGFIKALDSEGFVQGLVTNGAPSLVEADLGLLGTAVEGISFIEYGDQHPLPKPFPMAHQAAAQKAIQRLNERHGEACKPLVMTVEDSFNGVKGAHAAGLPAVQFLKPGHVPLTGVAGTPEFRAVRDMRTLAEILVTLSGR